MPVGYCEKAISHSFHADKIRGHIASAVMYVLLLIEEEIKNRRACPQRKCASTMDVKKFFEALYRHALCVIENWQLPEFFLGLFGGLVDEMSGFLKANDVSKAFAAIKEEPKREDALQNTKNVMGVFRKVKEIIGSLKTLPDVLSQDRNLRVVPTAITTLVFPYVYGSGHSAADRMKGYEIVELMIGQIGENDAKDEIIEGEVKRAFEDRTVLSGEPFRTLRDNLSRSGTFRVVKKSSRF